MERTAVTRGLKSALIARESSVKSRGVEYTKVDKHQCNSVEQGGENFKDFLEFR